MMLYGSSPDVLAQQQLDYDRLYGAAARANANAAIQARSDAIANILAQRKADESSRQFDSTMAYNRRNAAADDIFKATQADLNRTVLADNRKQVADQRNDKYQEGIVSEALQIPMQLPTDEGELQKAYPMLSPDRIKRISIVAKAARSQFADQINTEVKPYEDQNKFEQQWADRANAIQDAIAVKKPAATISPILPQKPTWADLYRGATNPIGSAASIIGRLVTPESPTVVLDSGHLDARKAELDAMMAGKNPPIQILPSGRYGPVTAVPPRPAMLQAPVVVPNPAPQLPLPPPQAPPKKLITTEQASYYLKLNKGNRKKAEAAAIADGFTF